MNTYEYELRRLKHYTKPKEDREKLEYPVTGGDSEYKWVCSLCGNLHTPNTPCQCTR